MQTPGKNSVPKIQLQGFKWIKKYISPGTSGRHMLMLECDTSTDVTFSRNLPSFCAYTYDRSETEVRDPSHWFGW